MRHRIRVTSRGCMQKLSLPKAPDLLKLTDPRPDSSVVVSSFGCMEYRTCPVYVGKLNLETGSPTQHVALV